jgi:sulfate adenylyltransferase
MDALRRTSSPRSSRHREPPLNAICAPIAPYAATRREVREMIEPLGGFIEVHVATPLDECERRDRKGLYKLAREGKLKQFTGIDDPYEAPVTPELSIDTLALTPDEAADLVLARIAEMGLRANPDAAAQESLDNRAVLGLMAG